MSTGPLFFFHFAKEVMTDDEKDCEDNTRHGSFLQSDPLRLTSIYLSIYLSGVAMEKLIPAPQKFHFDADHRHITSLSLSHPPTALPSPSLTFTHSPPTTILSHH